MQSLIDSDKSSENNFYTDHTKNVLPSNYPSKNTNNAITYTTIDTNNYWSNSKFTNYPSLWLPHVAHSPAPAPKPAPAPLPSPQPSPSPAPLPAPLPAPMPQPAPAPLPAPLPAPQPAPKPAPAPLPAPQPSPSPAPISIPQLQNLRAVGGDKTIYINFLTPVFPSVSNNNDYDISWSENGGRSKDVTSQSIVVNNPDNTTTITINTGTYNPITNGSSYNVNILPYWNGIGRQLSGSVTVIPQAAPQPAPKPAPAPLPAPQPAPAPLPAPLPAPQPAPAPLPAPTKPIISLVQGGSLGQAIIVTFTPSISLGDTFTSSNPIYSYSLNNSVFYSSITLQYSIDGSNYVMPAKFTGNYSNVTNIRFPITVDPAGLDYVDYNTPYDVRVKAIWSNAGEIISDPASITLYPPPAPAPAPLPAPLPAPMPQPVPAPAPLAAPSTPSLIITNTGPFAMVLNRDSNNDPNLNGYNINIINSTGGSRTTYLSDSNFGSDGYIIHLGSSNTLYYFHIRGTYDNTPDSTSSYSSTYQSLSSTTRGYHRIGVLSNVYATFNTSNFDTNSPFNNNSSNNVYIDLTAFANTDDTNSFAYGYPMKLTSDIAKKIFVINNHGLNQGSVRYNTIASNTLSNINIAYNNSNWSLTLNTPISNITIGYTPLPTNNTALSNTLIPKLGTTGTPAYGGSRRVRNKSRRNRSKRNTSKRKTYRKNR